MSQRIGLYGGSFDPIHFGHLISARSIAEQLGLARIVLIPSARPPHKRGVVLSDARHRLAMVKLAVAGDPLFEVSDVELHRAGPSYTIDTVADFRTRLGPEVELIWIIGADSLPELPTWHRIAELVTQVRIVTATRPGWKPPALEALAAVVGAVRAQALFDDCVSTPAIDISSTQIRERAAKKRSIRYLTPDEVTSYISKNGLYASLR
ncbi:MAG TPA: nicotinate-nucleotide adenylyltransferase [Phycisphaerae bacterium]|nr:nicotinate-nucleotide adenylyltransferase [Phycisphaerae bacterium]